MLIISRLLIIALPYSPFRRESTPLRKTSSNTEAALLSARWWLFEDRSSVRPWIGTCEIHLTTVISHPSFALAYCERERFEQTDLMPLLYKAVLDFIRNSSLHLNVTAIEGLLGEAGLLQGCLYIHAIVHDVGHKLRVSLALIPSTHDSKSDMDIALLHESGNDRMQRTLMTGERVWESRLELKTRSTVLKRETEAWSDHSRSIAGVIALNQGNNVALFVYHRKIDRRVAVLVQLLCYLRGDHFACRRVHINQLRALLRQVFGDHSFHWYRCEAGISDILVHVRIGQFLRLDHQVERLYGVVAVLCHGKLLHNVQHRKRSDALSIGRQLVDPPTAIRRRDGIDPFGLEVTKIRRGVRTTLLLQKLDHGLRHWTVVEGVPAMFSNLPQRVSERGISE